MKETKSKKKPIPIGSIIYLLNIRFDGKLYCFIGNMQTFGDTDNTEHHLNDLEFMFMPTIQNHYKLFKSCQYYLDKLKTYPDVLNINHSDQVFLNDEKAKFIEYCSKKFYLNNIMFNPEPSIINMFMRYNRKKKAEIKKWLRKATLWDLCKLAYWLKDKDIELINNYPRFFWFDECYKKVIQDAGLFPDDDDTLLTLMAVKDRLTSQKFIEELCDFSYYYQHPSEKIKDEMSNWKVCNFNTSVKKKKYDNLATYANKYMYRYCKAEGLCTNYELKRMDQRESNKTVA